MRAAMGVLWDGGSGNARGAPDDVFAVAAHVAAHYLVPRARDCDIRIYHPQTASEWRNILVGYQCAGPSLDDLVRNWRPGDPTAIVTTEIGPDTALPETRPDQKAYVH